MLSETLIPTFIFLSGNVLQRAGYDEEILYATLGSITIREQKGIEQYTLIYWQLEQYHLVEQEQIWPLNSKFGTINKIRLPRNKTEQNKQIKC